MTAVTYCNLHHYKEIEFRWKNDPATLLQTMIAILVFVIQKKSSYKHYKKFNYFL